MYCRKCGNELKEGAKFCGRCGAPVGGGMKAAPKSAPEEKIVPEPRNTPELKSVPELRITPEPKPVPEPRNTPELKPVPEPVSACSPNSPAEPETGFNPSMWLEPELQEEAQSEPEPEKASGRPRRQGGAGKGQHGAGKGKLIRVLLAILLLEAMVGAGVIGYMVLHGEKDGNKAQTESTEAAGEGQEMEKTLADVSGTEETRKEEPNETPDNAGKEAQETTAAEKGPIEYSLLYASQYDFGGMSKVGIVNVTETSQLVQKDVPTINNSGWMAFDSNIETSWQEGVDGPGIGESIKAYFSKPNEIQAISLLLGNHFGDHWYIENNRPKRIKLIFDDRTFEVEAPDDREEYVVVFSDTFASTTFELEIVDVYKGTLYDDTVIAEIGVYGY